MAKIIAVTLESNGNAAFAEDPATEMARILRETADKLEHSYLDVGGFRINDINGNKCGQVTISEDD